VILRRAGSGKLVANDQLTQAQWDALAATFTPTTEVVLTGFCRRKCAMIEADVTRDFREWGGYNLKTWRSFAVEANGDVFQMVPV